MPFTTGKIGLVISAFFLMFASDRGLAEIESIEGLVCDGNAQIYAGSQATFDVFGHWLDFTHGISVSGDGVVLSGPAISRNGLQNAANGHGMIGSISFTLSANIEAEPGIRTVTLSRPGGSDTFPIRVREKGRVTSVITPQLSKPFSHVSITLVGDHLAGLKVGHAQVVDADNSQGQPLGRPQHIEARVDVLSSSGSEVELEIDFIDRQQQPERLTRAKLKLFLSANYCSDFYNPNLPGNRVETVSVRAQPPREENMVMGVTFSEDPGICRVDDVCAATIELLSRVPRAETGKPVSWVDQPKRELEGGSSMTGMRVQLDQDPNRPVKGEGSIPSVEKLPREPEVNPSIRGQRIYWLLDPHDKFGWPEGEEFFDDTKHEVLVRPGSASATISFQAKACPGRIFGQEAHTDVLVSLETWTNELDATEWPNYRRHDFYVRCPQR